MGTGAETMALIEQEKPDLLLVDITYSGDQAQIEKMLRQKGRPEIPLVVLVSNLDEETVEKLSDLEPLRCLIKPFRQYELKFCIRSALRQGETIRRLREAGSVEADITARSQAAINPVGLGVMILKDERVTGLNRAAARMIDLSPEKMGDASLDRLAEIFQVSREEFKAIFNEELTAYPDASNTRLFKFRSRSGPARWMELSAGPLSFPDNRPGALLYLRDVTRMAVAEAERRTREIELQYAQKMEAVGTLAGSLALEFDRMMNNLRADSRALLNSGRTDRAITDCLELIDRAVLQGAELTAKMSGFSRRESRPFTRLNLNDLLKEIAVLLRGSLSDRIDIKLDLTRRNTFVLANARQMEQVVLNLAANACEAMPEGGELFFRTRLRNAGRDDTDSKGVGSVALIVEDTGVGIPTDRLPRIFEPFYSSKTEDAEAGLGLSMALSIVRNHGGEISVQPKQSQGVRFVVTLPTVVED